MLFDKYAQCQKYLIPKVDYYKTIDDLKAVAEVFTTIHIINTSFLTSMNYFCVVMWRNVSRRESHQKIAQSNIEDTYDIINKAHIETGHAGRDNIESPWADICQQKNQCC